MIIVFADTETCGLDPIDSAPFELAFLVYKDGILLDEKVFNLNPLNETILFSEEAYQVNGVSEETIRSYLPAEIVVPEIAAWLSKFVDDPEDRGHFGFGGYNAKFDFDHLKALFERYDVSIDYFFSGELIDVLELVKKSKARKLIGYTPNNRLETITKSLGIPHESIHAALGDIRATRKLYEHIWKLWKESKNEARRQR